jgi:peptidoglycan/xylan/chitin deacetylase (PgdA/CDA1 family)
MALLRQVREAWEVPRDLLLRRYPPFVTGGPLPRGDVPVFVFHSLEKERFGRQLAYLAENGYVTLGADQYLAVLQGREPAPERAVLLTFDDGRGSLWTVGGPLLRRHGMKGVVFLVPGRMESRPGPTPADGDDRARETGAGALLSWEETRALAAEGVFDFESHTQRHARVHVGPRVVGFLEPGRRSGYDAFDVPLIADAAPAGALPRDLLPAEAALGTPLLESEPRTGEALRFYEDPAVRERCLARAAQPGFFDRSGWVEELRALLPPRVKGHFETPAQREAAITGELAQARASIAAHTGRETRLLCYPWHAWGPLARRLAAATGYAAAFCGKVKGTPITRPGGDFLAIARVGDDYVELLPGRGRRSLTSVLTAKWRRRMDLA